MLDPDHPVAKLLREDRRYKLEAYAFVFEALNYAHDVLEMGSQEPSEPAEDDPPEERLRLQQERHLTGQQLCEAIRRYALEQYGYMAKTVLNSWGVHSTSDFGEIVFNLIRIRQMKKTRQDRREDFDNVFDFETGLRKSFKITSPEGR
jgi:uncharacterized repeat protein (TIGR04138 family)